jgi:hypothetical protein
MTLSSPGVEETREVNEKSALVPITNDFGPIFSRGPFVLAFYEFF